MSLRRIALAALAGILFGCAAFPLGPDVPGRVESRSLADPSVTTLGRTVGPLSREREGESGFLLLERGEEALLWRGALSDRAERTLDAQYFIWSEDNVGTIAAERLLRAAQRGVRVRVLVDDMMLSTDPRYVAMLDAHPRIEIRIYNPSGVVGRSDLRKYLTLPGEFARLNRRMHNKAFVADGAVAILGGRNVADEYYDMHREFNFRDRDVLAVGPVVGEIARSFDEYWNSVWAVPVAAVVDAAFTDAEREAYYERLRGYALDRGNFPARFEDGLARTGQRLAGLGAELEWGQARLIYDVPGKNDDPRRMNAFGESGRQLTAAAASARRELLAETPYFVVMPGTLGLLRELRARGVDIRVLTNSLASTDNVPAFSSYRTRREELLALGLALHELLPHPEHLARIVERTAHLAQQPRLALHAKTLVIDRRTVFVGSFNMDPRSTHLNTELGLLIDSPALAQSAARAILEDMRPENSWRVWLDPADGGLVWTSRAAGVERRERDDPDVSSSKRFATRLLSLLPIEELL